MGATATKKATAAKKTTATTKTPSATSREADTIQNYSEEKITGFLSIPLVKQITDILMDGIYYFLYMTLLYVIISLVSYRNSNSTESGSRMIIIIILFAMGLMQPAWYRYRGILKWYEVPPTDEAPNPPWSEFTWSLFWLFLFISVLCAWNYFPKKEGDSRYLLDIDDGFEVDTSLSADIANAFINIKSPDPIASLDKFIIGGIIIQLIVMSIVTITSNPQGKDEEEQLKISAENKLNPFHTSDS